MARPEKGGAFRKFREAVLKSALIVTGDRVLVACSGGPDSVALAGLLLKLREEMPLEISVAHFNHRLRPGAADDETFVRDLTKRWVVPFIREARDVKAEARRKKLNLEEAARLARYDFLRRAAGRWGATKIATGHTMNDQAETFLMRLCRGTGLTGLAGIEPVSGPAECPVVRPLLGLRRGEIEAFLEEEGLAFRTDPSNLDRKLLRNRIRLGLLPELERGYEPRIVEHLAALASLVREEDGLLASIVRELAEDFIARRGGEVSLDVRTLALLPPALGRRVVREFIRELKGDLRSVTAADIEAVLGLKDGGRKTVRKGLVLRREKGRLFRWRGRAPAPAFEMSWDGRGGIRAGGATYEGTALAKGKGLRVKGDDARRAVLDAAKLRFPLTVRSRRAGDLYRPLGAPGRKKIKEIFRAKGVPREDRDRLPVFLSGGEIVWVPGLPAAEAFKVEAGTRHVFRIEKKGGGRRSQRR